MLTFVDRARRRPDMLHFHGRADVQALKATMDSFKSKLPRSWAILVGILLHGYYHKTCLKAMAKIVELHVEYLTPYADLATSDALRAVLRMCADLVAAGIQYNGPKKFPYQWLEAGEAYVASVMPCIVPVFAACLSLSASESHPSWSQVDAALPSAMGNYSATEATKC